MRRLVVLALAGAMMVPVAAAPVAAQEASKLEALCYANSPNAADVDTCLDVVHRILYPGSGPVRAETPRPIPEATGAAGSVCYLIRDEEVADVMGYTPSMSFGSEAGGLRSCYWYLYADPMTAVTLEIGRGDGYVALGDLVPGLGDAADWWGGSMLQIRTGDHRMSIMLFGEGDLKAKAIELARYALARML